MKKLPLLLTLLLCSCNEVAASSTISESVSESESESSSMQENYDVELPVFFDTNNATQEISPNIYGTFIEHIDTCIYNGLWSEMILDRKFHDPVGEDTSQWTIVGTVTNNVNSYKSAPNASKISVGSAIYQNGIALDENKDYDGYFYASGNGTIRVRFKNSDEEITKEFNVNSNEMVKFTYSIHSQYKNKKTKIYFEVTDGEITIDSMSLMPADNYYGMRKDTLDLLVKLNAPFYRWPGGNFVSGYDFKDGIGDRDERVSKRNLNYCGLESDFANKDERIANDIIKIGSLGFYGAFEPNDYGIDEFIMMCRYLNAEPNIVVNSGLGDATNAANEVEYCNGSSSTTFGKLRQQEEPYNVKYFSIGNEMNGSWQLGHVSIDEYTIRHNEFYNAMKKVDSSIEIIGVGDNYSSWSSNMVKNCEMDYISEHFYGARNENDSKTHINSLKQQAEMRIGKHRDLNATDVYMSIDEYAYENAECPSRLKDGMGVALVLNTFIKNADVVKIACYSSTINATQGSITTDKYKAYMQGNGYALTLYRNNLLNYYLPLTYQISKVKDASFEIIATTNKDKNQIALGIVNSGEQTIKLTNEAFKNIISIKYVTSESIEDYDKDGQEKFQYVENDNPTSALIQPRSITTIVIQL